MAGPTKPIDAKIWIKAAVEAERYTPTPHFLKQLVARRFDMNDATHACTASIRVEPYPATGENGGTRWTVFGRDVDCERDVAVGVEAYLDEDGQAAVLITIIDTTEKR